MLISYKNGKTRITKDFSSVEVECTKKGGLFSKPKFALVGVVGNERVILREGLSKKKADALYGEVILRSSNPFLWGGVTSV